MASPGDIIVRVGGVADRSLDAVFASIPERAQRAFGAAKRASKEAQSGMAADGRGALSGQRALEAQQLAVTKARAAAQLAVERDRFRENSRLNRQILAEASKTERAMAVQAAKSSRERTAARLSGLQTEEKAERDYQARLLRMKLNAAREQNRATRAAAREAAREAYRSEREIDRFATRTSHRATRFFFPRPEGALGYGKRIAGDLMRGAGVDFSLAGGVSRAKERESAGMGLAQQERIATGKTRGGAAWAEVSRGVGEKLNVGGEQVTELIRAFTGKTGEFDAAAAKAGELASMTLAAGANMGEMGSAAGFVYNQLKDMPDAAERTLDVMRGIVGQTAVGAVEMEEYAKQMGRIAANAKMFEGDVSKNILELSALTQLAAMEGGGTGGADAARSIVAFANTTSKGQRINAFKKHGIDLFNEGGTQKRPMLEIIRESLVKSKGNIPEMTKMWADVLGQKPIKAMANAFNKAEAENAKKKTGKRAFGEAGWEASLAKVKPFMDVQMSKEQERANVEEYQKTMAAKAQAFQAKLDRITESLASNLLPALEKLAPQVLNLANSFTKAIQWAAGNPWQAVMVLLGASVARAATESLGRLMLERVLTKAAGPVGEMSTAGKGAAGATAIAVGAATFAITTATLNAASVMMQGSKKARAESYDNTFKEFTREYSEAKTPEERAKVIETARKRAELTSESRENTLMPDVDKEKTLRAIAGFVKEASTGEKPWTPGDLAPAQGKQAATAEEVGRNVAMALKGQQLEVKVVNVDEMSKPFSAPIPGAFPALPSFSQ